LRALRSLASPVRHEIVDCIAAGGPLSVAELAAELGRAPQSLYFHVQRLCRAGLLEVCGERRLARHVETLYASSRLMRLTYDVRDRGFRRALRAMASSMQRVAMRDFARGLESPLARPDGRRRNLWAARIVAWVSPEELAEVNSMLMTLLGRLATTRGAKRTERVALQWTLAPLIPARSSRVRRLAAKTAITRTRPRAGRRS